jgi:FtsZ-interacting cell division protein ZipA
VTATVIAIVVVLVVLAVAGYVIQQKNRQANIDRADQLRQQAATTAQATLPQAQDEAAEAAAEAEAAQARAEQARADAEAARVEAARAEAEHESQVRAADRLDPRVDHEADDYAPQVAGTTDQQPTPPSEVNTEPTPEPAPETATEPTPEPAAESTTEPAPEQTDETGSGPLLPRRTPGAQEMPGKPIEKTDEGGGWFTKKDGGSDSTS